MDRLLRVGVVGLGRAASSMLPSLRAHPHVALTAAADSNPEALRRFAADFGGKTYGDAAAMCADDAVDAVYIATPHQCHRDDVVAAASHGKHIVVEKPMALTLEECRAMIAAAEAAGVVLIVGHTHAFDPSIPLIHEIIASGELGPPRMITNVVYTDFLYRPRRPEELDTALGGGIMYNQVPHQIELVRALADAPLRSVKALTGIWDDTRPTEGAMAALLEFENRVVASLVYSGYDHVDGDELQFWIAESGVEKRRDGHGAARRALGAATGPEAEARMKAESGFAGRGVRTNAAPAHQPHFGMLLVSCERGDLRPSADGVLIYDEHGMHERLLPPARAFPNKDTVVDALYDAVVRGRPPRFDGRWGMATLEASLALIESARTRREIVLEPRDRRHTFLMHKVTERDAFS
jgi:phthalate 4,5-cis-dihydrodiol dehydrogenase